MEKQIFQRPLEDVWQDCIEFFRGRDPEQIERAEGDVLLHGRAEELVVRVLEEQADPSAHGAEIAQRPGNGR